VRTLKPWAGDPSDRVAEFAATILRAGVGVEVSPAVVDLVRTGSYVPEHRRWFSYLKAGAYEGYLRIYHERLDPATWAALKALPGRFYDRNTGMTLISPSHWEAIEDAAERFGFRFTPDATNALAAAKQRHRNAVLGVIPSPVVVAPVVRKAVQAGEIDPRLIDDEDEVSDGGE
jgi:hypothetical protein